MGLLPIHEAMLDVEVHMDGEFVGDTHLLDSSSEDLDTSEDSSQEEQHPTQTTPHSDMPIALLDCLLPTVVHGVG